MGRVTAAVVTGVGVVSPLATTAGEHFDALVAGRSGIGVAAEPEYEKYAPQLEARVTGYDRRAAIENRMLRKVLAASPGFAVGAAGEAIADAGLAGADEVLAGCGLYVGSLSLEIDPEVFVAPLRASLTKDGEFDLSLFATRGMKLLDPLFLVRALPNAGLCGVSLEHQILGPNTNLTNGPTSGLAAVALAVGAVERGEIACAVAGGYDSLLVMDAIAEHLIAGRLARNGGAPERACRPFDRSRAGYVLGEGAAFVVVESAEHARSRGAAPYGQILSYASTTDPDRLAASDPLDGTALEHAARSALRGAGVSADGLGAIFGDGLGTELDDVRESRVVSALVDGAEVPFTAPTAAIGYTGAASGVFSLVHAMLALRRGLVPPLPACEQLDPRCPVHPLASPAPLEPELVLVWNSERAVKNVALVAAAGAA
jgi:3-oxoacyl-[acyl-carrier-protein] synthase II